MRIRTLRPAAGLLEGDRCRGAQIRGLLVSPQRHASATPYQRCRLEVVGKQLAESAGVKIVASGYSFGEYDIAVIAEAADDTTMAAVALVLTAGGALKVAQTTPLLSGPQGVAAMQKAPSITYRPAR